MAIKAIVFTRVSSLTQSLEDQQQTVMKEALKDYDKNEIKIIEGKESAVKLTEEKRTTLNEMKGIIKNNPTVETIYFFGVDRLARRVRVVIDVLDDLTKMGINCVFLNPAKINTIDIKNGVKTESPLGHLMLLFLGYSAEMESKMLKARTKNSKELLRTQGKVASGSVLFGYKKLSDNSIAIDENTSWIVRQIFNKYAKGNTSLSKLHIELSSDSKISAVTDFFKDGKQSTNRARITSLIKNKAYSGRNNENTKNHKSSPRRYTNIYPAIVDVDLQEKCIKQLSLQRKKPKTISKNIYYAKGIIRNYSDDTHSALIPQRHNCVYRTNREDKTQFSVSMNVVDSICRNEMIDGKAKLLTKQNDETINNYKDKINSNKDNIAEIENKIDDINAHLIYMQKQLLSGRVSENVFDELKAEDMKKLKDWNNEKAKIESENNQLQSYINSITTEREKDNEIIDSIKQQIAKTGMLTNELNKTLENDKTINNNTRIKLNLEAIDDDLLIEKYVKEVIDEIRVYYVSRFVKKIEIKLNPLLPQQFKEEYIYTNRGGKITLEKKYYSPKTNELKLVRDITSIIVKRFHNLS